MAVFDGACYQCLCRDSNNKLGYSSWPFTNKSWNGRRNTPTSLGLSGLSFGLSCWSFFFGLEHPIETLTALLCHSYRYTARRRQHRIELRFRRSVKGSIQLALERCVRRMISGTVPGGHVPIDPKASDRARFRGSNFRRNAWVTRQTLKHPNRGAPKGTLVLASRTSERDRRAAPPSHVVPHVDPTLPGIAVAVSPNRLPVSHSVSHSRLVSHIPVSHTAMHSPDHVAVGSAQRARIRHQTIPSGGVASGRLKEGDGRSIAGEGSAGCGRSSAGCSAGSISTRLMQTTRSGAISSGMASPSRR